jgi:predicted esterase
MELHFQHPKTFRVEVLHPETASICVLYALHGYGQLARYFVQKLRHLPEHVLIVAPEGMHRFYLNGHSGRVGASWMTKEAREIDIRDNLEWLNALDAQLTKQYLIRHKILLGFSQGGATAIRWAAQNPNLFDSLLVWGSDFPPDAKTSAEQFGAMRKHFILGDTDEFIQGERKDELLYLYKQLDFQLHTYPGAHDIQGELLQTLVQEEIEKLR